MSRPLPFASICLAFLATLVLAAGCGAPRNGEEAALRSEAYESLSSLAQTEAFRYHLRLESWVGVSGQTVYGNESCEGLRTSEGFTVSVKRFTPVGDEEFAVLVWNGRPLRREGGEAWSELDASTPPNPLYDPILAVSLGKHVHAAALESEEEREGSWCRRVLLRLDPGVARDVLTAGAWSYFSSLRFELSLRIWMSDAASPPLSLQLEVLGYEPEENLLRYRLLATLDPYDLGAPGISLPHPEE